MPRRGSLMDWATTMMMTEGAAGMLMRNPLSSGASAPRLFARVLLRLTSGCGLRAGGGYEYFANEMSLNAPCPF